MRTYSVHQLNSYIKGVLDSEELLKNIAITGEITNFKVNGQTAYFTLKDELAQISCIYFDFSNEFLIKDGDQILCKGTPTFFIRGGRLSFNVVYLEPSGTGEAFLQLRALKSKLMQEGIFDKKITKPKYIKTIGVITSSEGAAIYDIISVAKRRDKRVNIILYAVKVQGIGAEIEIANAIKELDNYSAVDCILVTRGGGSYEDLSAYNTEEVARSVAGCEKFVVSAVGHETDYTLCDFAADLRMPTPSAAAEILTEDLDSIIYYIEQTKKNLNKYISNLYSNSLNKLNSKVIKLESGTERKLYSGREKILNKASKLQNSIFLNLKQTVINDYLAKLKAVDPRKILSLGYAKLFKANKTVNTIKELKKDDTVMMYLSDGSVQAEITDDPINYKKN